MQLPLAYLDASAIEEIPLEIWSNLFDVEGWPSSIVRQSLTHDSIGDALRRDEPTDGILLALEAVHTLGTDEGREALISAMRDRHVDLKSIPDGCGEREFAMRAFLLQRAEPSFADAFVRAQIQVQAGVAHRAVNEFWGQEARVVTSVGHVKRRLEELVLVHCKEHDLGDHVRTEACDEDGVCVFQVIHSDRKRTPLAVVDGSATRSRIQFRPVHCDVLRYDGATGRLQIIARRASMVDAYVRVFGEACFADPVFFVSEAACTLEPLQKRGRAALETDRLPGVGRVWMTECVWERGDRSVVRIRSHDCFDDLEHLKLPLDQEGRLVEVKLKVQVAQQGTRPVTVTIRLPGKITVTNARHEGLVHAYLERIGVRCRASSRRDLDLWGLHPWRHSPSTWRAVFGDRVEGLLEAKAFESVELESVPHPDIRGAGNALQVERVGVGEFYGVGREPEASPMSLTATDVEGLALNVPAFRAYLGTQLGLAHSNEHSAADAVLDLGLVTIGEFTFRPFYLLSSPPDGFAAKVRKTAAPHRPVLLVPPGRTSGSDLPEISLSSPIPSRRELERALVVASDLESLVPAIHCAYEGARLVVDTRAGIVWVDGVHVAGLKPDTHPFRFVEAVARANSAPVSSSELTKQISRNREDDTATARKAKQAAKQAIAEALAGAGRELGIADPFPSATKGSYRCALPADVR